MSTSTHDLLQQQIQKLEDEGRMIQKEIESYNLRFATLNTRLDELTTTNKQLRAFQAQLNGGGLPQHSSNRRASNLVGHEAGFSESAIAGIAKSQQVGASVSQNSYHYSAEQLRFINNWMHQKDEMGWSYMNLKVVFNKQFNSTRSERALRDAAARIRTAGQLNVPVPDYTLGENIPSYGKLNSRQAQTPPPTSSVKKDIGLTTPPVTPQKSEDIHIEILDECAVIVSVGNDLWYELRCYVCGRNASANGRFFQGYEGMCRHLLHAHESLDTMEGEDDIDFILRKCILRQVTVQEVEAIENGRHKLDKIKKDDPYGAQMVQQSGIVVIPQQQQVHADQMDSDITIPDGLELDQFECSVCGHLSKAEDTPEVCQTCGWATCVVCYGVGDIFDQDRAVHICSNDDKMETESSASTMPAPSELGRWKNKFAAMELAPLLQILDDFCPCTLSGHLCRARICKKKELCLEHFHGLHCVNKNHELKPSCPDAMKTGECILSPLNCKYEHEELHGHRFAIAMYHECECLEH